jgi:hypothetical protein
MMVDQNAPKICQTTMELPIAPNNDFVQALISIQIALTLQVHGFILTIQLINQI